MIGDPAVLRYGGVAIPGLFEWNLLRIELDAPGTSPGSKHRV